MVVKQWTAPKYIAKTQLLLVIDEPLVITYDLLGRATLESKFIIVLPVMLPFGNQNAYVHKAKVERTQH